MAGAGGGAGAAAVVVVVVAAAAAVAGRAAGDVGELSSDDDVSLRRHPGGPCRLASATAAAVTPGPCQSASEIASLERQMAAVHSETVSDRV